MSPIQVPRSGFPPLCFVTREYVVCVVVVAGSCLPRFRGRQEFVMGSLWAHGGSTTFPWVPSRPVQLGYDRAVRAA